MSEVVLLSGGIDSAVCLWRAAKPIALFVDYGQPARVQELAAAQALCWARDCELAVMDAPLALGKMGAVAGEPGPRVVGGRNAILLALGVNLAVERGASVVWIGAQPGDQDNYPDCRASFLTGLDRIYRAAYGVGVDAPLIMISRANLAAEARRLPQGLTWSCYSAVDGRPCGTCNSCRQER